MARKPPKETGLAGAPVPNPRFPTAEQRRRRGIKVQLWTPEDVVREWEEAAGLEGMSLSGWIRRAATRTMEMERKVRQIQESGALG